VERAFDVVVLGAGVAGVAAALAAHERGARCALVRASPGATALGAGGWTGSPPERLRAQLAAAGLELRRCRAPLAHAIGELRRCDLAAATHAAASPAARTLVAGIAGLPTFRAAALASLWGDEAGVELHAVMLSLPRTPPAGWAPAALAAALESDPGLLALPLATEVRRTGALAVLLPPVLGLAEWTRVHAEIERAAGVPVGEALAAPPSLPGLRLYRALERVTHDAGIAVVSGRVTDRHATGDALESVSVGTPTSVRRLHGRAWVLATGRFVGGGVQADPTWREPALGLPIRVTHIDTVFTRMEPLVLADPDRTRAQSWLRVGVEVGADHRPLDEHGEPRYTNLFAAGDVIAGATAGLGEAASAGWSAGTRAAAAAATSTIGS
jgi:glycerol-3-phosphate dehydrogenase subunit B